MSIVFFGSPRFAATTLVSLITAGEDVRAVVTQPDKRRGRGGAMMPSAVKETALRYNIPVFEPVKLKDPGFAETLKSYSPDFLVVVAYGRILPAPVLNIPKIAPVNLHASLLPKYRGAAPIAWAIINGETETGVCTMLMSEGLDEGDVLLCERTAIDQSDNAETLTNRLADMGGPLLIKTLRGLRNGSVKPTPQAGAHSYAPMLRKEDGHIDWSRPAHVIYNFIRGMQPWPGAHCALSGVRVKILEARPLKGRTGAPGVVIAVERDAIIVGAGEDTSVAIMKLQPEGKNPMTAPAFLAGRKIKPGDALS